MTSQLSKPFSCSSTDSRDLFFHPISYAKAAATFATAQVPDSEISALTDRAHSDIIHCANILPNVAINISQAISGDDWSIINGLLESNNLPAVKLPD